MAAIKKPTKKRPAPSQAGPTQKKVHLEKKPQRPADRAQGDKPRSRPVTWASEENPGSDSENEDGSEPDIEDDGAMQIDVGAIPGHSSTKDPHGTDSYRMSVPLPSTLRILFDFQHLGSLTRPNVRSTNNVGPPNRTHLS
jgi:pumilio family protein 6